MKKVFINKRTKAIIIAKLQNSMEYDNDNNYIFLHEGSNKSCLEFIDSYWEENHVLDEQRMFLQD